MNKFFQIVEENPPPRTWKEVPKEYLGNLRKEIQRSNGLQLEVINPNWHPKKISEQAFSNFIAIKEHVCNSEYFFEMSERDQVRLIRKLSKGYLIPNEGIVKALYRDVMIETNLDLRTNYWIISKQLLQNWYLTVIKLNLHLNGTGILLGIMLIHEKYQCNSQNSNRIPYIRLLREITGLTENTVRKYIKRLTEIDLIRTMYPNENNLYEIDLVNTRMNFERQDTNREILRKELIGNEVFLHPLNTGDGDSNWNGNVKLMDKYRNCVTVEPDCIIFPQTLMSTETILVTCLTESALEHVIKSCYRSDFSRAKRRIVKDAKEVIKKGTVSSNQKVGQHYKQIQAIEPILVQIGISGIKVDLPQLQRNLSPRRAEDPHLPQLKRVHEYCQSHKGFLYTKFTCIDHRTHRHFSRKFPIQNLNASVKKLVMPKPDYKFLHPSVPKFDWTT